MFGALQRMRDRDQRAASVKRARKRHDGVGRDACDGGSPCRVLGLAVRLSQQVAFENRPTYRIAVEEFTIVQSFPNKRVHQREHQSGVGAGDVADPLRAGFVGQIGAQRAHIHKLAAARACARHGATLDVLADAAAGHHAVLQRHATEGDHDVTMVSDLLPGQITLRQLLIVAKDVRQQDRGGARTI